MKLQIELSDDVDQHDRLLFIQILNKRQPSVLIPIDQIIELRKVVKFGNNDLEDKVRSFLDQLFDEIRGNIR